MMFFLPFQLWPHLLKGRSRAAARTNDELRRQDDALGRAFRRLDPAEQKAGGLLSELPSSDGDRRQRWPMHGALWNVVKPNDRDVAAGRQAEIDEAQHDAQCAEVVVAKDRGRRLRFSLEQPADCSRAF